MKMKQTEIGLIPDDWEVKTIDEFATLTSGESPSKFKFIDGGIPYYKVEQMNNSLKYQKETPFHIQTLIFVQKGSVIFPKRGAAIETNKVRILSQDSFFDTNIMSVTLNETVSNEYFYYWLVKKELWQIADTTSIPQINNKHIKPLLVPIPPLAEQQRIAKALSDVDALISTTEKLLQKKKNIKQGAMQELLTGKKRLPGFAKTTNYKQSELGLIPEDWEVKSLGEMVKIGHGRDYKNLKSGDVPVYGTGGYMTSVNDFLYEGETVCIGRKGTIDKPQYHSGKIWTVDTLFYTYDFKSLNPKYLFYKFCLIDWLSMNEASGVPSLTAKNIEDIQIALPPEEEQTTIASVLSSMDKEIETLNTKLEKYRNLKTAMMQQLLTGKIRLV